MEPVDKRISGIDYARAFFSVCIVGIHAGYFSPSSIFSPDLYPIHEFGFSDFVNFYIFLLAVPAYLIISNYLFAMKPYNWTDLSKRLIRYIKLVIFWSITYNLIANHTILVPHSSIDAFLLLLSGNHTLYYFFVSLAILTIITHFAKLLPNVLLILLIFLSVIIVGLLPILSIKYQIYKLAILWNPLNFLPYPFAAVLIYRLRNQNIKRLYWILISLLLIVFSFLAGMLDWTVYVNGRFFTVNLYAIPAYSRPSLVLLSILTLILVVNIRIRMFPVIDFMSKQSLALYCLHFFFLPVGILISGYCQLTGIASWIVTVTSILLISYAAALILPSFFNKDLLR